MTKSWKRARSPEKIEERRQSILIAALKLFRDLGYDKVSFNAIAAEAKFTQSNLYRYFSSREEIYLTIFCKCMTEWFDDLKRVFEGSQPQMNPKDFANKWVSSLVSHTDFMNLAVMLFTSLERNSSLDQLVKFKDLTNEIYAAQEKLLSFLYPVLGSEASYRFAILAFGSMTSLWSMSNCNDIMLKVYDMERFQVIKPDFERDFESSISIILTGLLNSYQESETR